MRSVNADVPIDRICVRFAVRWISFDSVVYGSDLRVYRQYIAVTTGGMELTGGGSKRLPCNVKSDEVGYWIRICEGSVIVSLAETCHRLLSPVKGSRQEEAMRERRKAEGARDPSVFRETPG